MHVTIFHHILYSFILNIVLRHMALHIILADCFNSRYNISDCCDRVFLLWPLRLCLAEAAFVMAASAFALAASSFRLAASFLRLSALRPDLSRPPYKLPTTRRNLR